MVGHILVLEYKLANFKDTKSRAPCKRSLLSFAWPRRLLPFDEVKGTNNLHGGSILAWSTLILRLFHFE